MSFGTIGFVSTSSVATVLSPGSSWMCSILPWHWAIGVMSNLGFPVFGSSVELNSMGFRSEWHVVGLVSCVPEPGTGTVEIYTIHIAIDSAINRRSVPDNTAVDVETVHASTVHMNGVDCGTINIGVMEFLIRTFQLSRPGLYQLTYILVGDGLDLCFAESRSCASQSLHQNSNEILDMDPICVGLMIWS